MSKITFLEAFNAKHLKTDEVVSSFVPSDHFRQLAGMWSALLIGPRGSGKTTYLRMLTLNALRSWEHQEAEKYREAIQYVGIYVPADMTWGGMINSLGRGKLKSDCFEVIAHAAFTTHVLQAVIRTLEDRLAPDPQQAEKYKSVSIDSSDLSEFVREISDLWKLKLRTVSLRGIKHALENRLLDIKSKASIIAAIENHTLNDVHEKIDHAGLDTNDAVTAALSKFDDLINEPEGKWALLLDEFEIAPRSLQEQMIAQMRSANKKLIYKIALAPCGEHTDKLATDTPPSSGNDYKQVELWHKEKNDVIEFCNQIFESKLGRKLEKSTNEIFGPAADNAEDLTVWSARWKAEFEELAEKDESFRNFLVKKSIDIETFDASSKAKNASVVRKIAPIVQFRNAFKNTANNRKPRKKLPFYSGWENIATISEGNPRWLIGILNLMEAKCDKLGTPLGSTEQYDVIDNATGVYAAMLRNAAAQQGKCLISQNPVYGVLEKIGSYFNARVIDHDFLEEFSFSFDVDDKVNSDTENALRIAFNLGAIICMSESNELGGYSTLKGRRFRLTYMLAPVFDLPLRSTKSISLSSILSRSNAAIPDSQMSMQLDDFTSEDA